MFWTGLTQHRGGIFCRELSFQLIRAHDVLLAAVQVGETNHERRAEKLEKKLARYAIMPVLQAEEDRRSGQQICTVMVDQRCVPGAGGPPPATLPPVLTRGVAPIAGVLLIVVPGA